MTTVPRWIAYEPLDGIVGADRNPKRHDPSIAASLSRFGYVEAITVDERTGRLVAGHGRVDDLRAKHAAGEGPPEGVVVAEDGTWTVPVQHGWSSADDGEAAAYVLVSNQSTIAGGWDEEAVTAMLQEMTDGGTLVDGLGFDDLVTAGSVSVRGYERRGLDTDPADLAEAPGRVRPGDVWDLGPHRLVCGDSRDRAVVDRTCEGAPPPDQVWTDPPYGVSVVGRTADALTIVNDDLDPEALRVFLAESLGNAVAVARPGATVFVAAPSGPLGDVFAAVLSDLGCRRHTLVWVKDRFVLGRGDYHYRHEFLYYGLTPTPADPAHTHVPIMYGWKPGAAHTGPAERTFDTVWEFARPSRSESHPTMKPVPLIEKAIANHTPQGAHILDVFAGSGSTLIAADNLLRVAHLVELDPVYCDVILDRWERHGGAAPVLLDRTS